MESKANCLGRFIVVKLPLIEMNHTAGGKFSKAVNNGLNFFSEYDENESKPQIFSLILTKITKKRENLND